MKTSNDKMTKRVISQKKNHVKKIKTSRKSFDI